MPFVIPYPEDAEDKYAAFRTAIKNAIADLWSGEAQTVKGRVTGTSWPQGAETILNAIGYPYDYKEMLHGQLANMVAPAELALNYRNPNVIKELRHLMAEEQRARGPMAQVEKQVLERPPGLTPFEYLQWHNAQSPESLSAVAPQPDPADLILRGSWFNGMKQEARDALTATINPKDYMMVRDATIPRNAPLNEFPLAFANYAGLPASSHAIPGGYVRFGEPYGVSLTASPSVGRKFSPDEYISRVMPLYGGPPTERTLQLWKPEHQRVFNEAYNEAFNNWLSKPMGVDYRPTGVGSSEVLPSNMLRSEATGKQLENIYKVMASPDAKESIDMALMRLANNHPQVEQFNTQFSNTLQNQGIRGLLYNPRRYGEYEMLMLDPKYAQVLDYRPVESYVSQGLWNRYKDQTIPGGVGITPGSARGYNLAAPEFEANHARLSDMFNMMPWTDRISQDNWQRILQQVDPQYVDAIVNQLFGNR